MPDLFTFEHFKRVPSMLHAVTTRSDDLPYAFSLALHTGEAPEQIVANRNRLSRLLSSETPLHYVLADQTHSDNIQYITRKETRGWESLSDAVKECDALITDVKGVVLGILTADCVPILLYDRQKEVVAAVHAGWKGTKAQIASKTVQKMIAEYGCDPEAIMAGIAPAIGRCCYEVGEEVAEHFFHTPEALTQKGEKYMLDLPFINQKQLLEAGLKEEN
ncbi:MAG TPA: peptidoglycan editing factor PgeF, partial [Sulfurovum sp.]|uniref:peptidoglycan editing factor PgeF n=1 Tax=Sulfurovum sp. TaxID=1969726 RepID=UPI002F955154